MKMMMIRFKVIAIVIIVSAIATTAAVEAVPEYKTRTETKSDEPLQSQESFDSFGGALGTLRDHLDTPSYDDLHKYGGIGGKKLLSSAGLHLGSSLSPPPSSIYDHGSDGYKHYYGDGEHLDQALNKYTGQHKVDKYGGKSDDYKDYHGAHVYHRNRGYGYEKHYMFDKEYSTGKHSGAHGGHHSYYGDHDHGSKHTVDAHKTYERKKVGSKSSHSEHTYKTKPDLVAVPIYDDAGTGGVDLSYGTGGGGVKTILKHKKDFLDHHLKRHHDYHHHDHQPYETPQPVPVTYAKVHQYVPVIDPGYGTTTTGHLYGMPAPIKTTGYSPPISAPTYSAVVEPEQLVYHHHHHPTLYQSTGSGLAVPVTFDDSLYVSSASDVRKTAGGSSSSSSPAETEGESINTFSPKINGAAESSATAEINTAPLISTRHRHHHHRPNSSPSSGLSAESFARITTAVHATPPLISTHLYRSANTD